MNQVRPEAWALGLGRAWLGLGPGLGVFPSPSPPKPGPHPGWARAAGPDGPLGESRWQPSALGDTANMHRIRHHTSESSEAVKGDRVKFAEKRGTDHEFFQQRGTRE
ncbi:hypothetical protein GGX14DRAFT_387708 [Mycena pura]|uniref:Uncharacterized protein n=1 Tax=Mycena pura TaxID=153505 RepID=A0AAD7E2B8_9AGAR|nr:hypothetical protein GGX14DRAFT_387708 [Mycena pura]